MPSERRLERINEVIRRVISERILEAAHFPPNVFLTVTRVKITGNLEWADVDVSVFPEQYNQPALKFLEHQRADFQREINEALQARRTPKIRFHLDETLAKIEDIFPAS